MWRNYVNWFDGLKGKISAQNLFLQNFSGIPIFQNLFGHISFNFPTYYNNDHAMTICVNVYDVVHVSVSACICVYMCVGRCMCVCIC